jgi:transposase
VRMVMLQSPLVRLPLDYELTPLKQGERTVAQRLLGHLRRNDLVLMDRGFFSYGIFRQIQQQEAFFAIRLMRGVRLKTLKKLGPSDRLVRWTPADRKWKAKGLAASITLRLIDYQIKGFRPSAIVTNTLNPRQISRNDWVRLTTQSDAGKKLAPGLYHRRWEIETTFCELKVRQGMEGSLRSRKPEGIAYEIAGHVLLYLLVRWLMVKAALARGLDPLRLSFTGALRELKAMGPALMVASVRRVHQELLPRLLQRIVSHQVPWRPGRHDPRPGDTRLKCVGKGKYRLPSKLAVAKT